MSETVCLVNMPYSSIIRPSLALGLIETYIKEYNHAVDVIYANLEFAKIIGLAEYDEIDNSHFHHMLGEWTFSHAAFPNKPNTDEQFFALFSDITEVQKQHIFRVRDKAETYIMKLAERIYQTNPKIVACTSTFQQNCASLALLKKLKELNPNIITIMGGANCESIMGQTISENFTWVDYVFSGECDAVIGEFIDKLMHDVHISPHNLPHGFIAQGHSDLLISNAAENKQPPRGYIEDMSQVKAPTYDSYFETLNNLNLTEFISPGLLAETSRGCWWGAKKHCTFCGLNGLSMEHRCKSAEAVIDEFKQQSDKYNVHKFELVDNIFPQEYMKTLLPELSEERQYNLFFETKSNLKKQHVEQYKKAGINWVQPGFESLHDGFLKLVDKGVTGIQNISALKWLRNYGIHVFWNILYGAPGEQEQWYDEMAEVIPLITHLQPPHPNLLKLTFPRFSPYHKTPDKYGLELAPAKSYQYIYPLTGQNLLNIAYFHNHQSEKEDNIFSLNGTTPPETASHNNLQTQIKLWFEQWSNSSFPLLYMCDKDEQIVVVDTREVSTNSVHILSGLMANVYRLCDEPITFERLKSKVTAIDQEIDDDEINQCLTFLIENNLLLSMSNCYLTLALVGETPPMPDFKDRPAGVLNLN